MTALMARLKNFNNDEVLKFLIAFAGISVIISGTSNLLSGEANLASWINGVFQNLGTEMAGAFVTFFFFEQVIGQRELQMDYLLRLQMAKTPEERQAILDAMKQRKVLEKAELIDATLHHANLASANMAQANLQRANLHQAQLENIQLQGANCRNTNFKEAKLGNANLQAAILRDATLRHAQCTNANFTGANLRGAEVEYATLSKANFYGADMRGAKFKAANFKGAHLKHAILYQAILENANLTNVTFDELTVLPDAEFVRDDEDGNPIYNKYWRPNVDMGRYTDPNHRYFWQPMWAKLGFTSYEAWADAGFPTK